MHPSLKKFLVVFCFISALIGIALAVVNASQKPAATTPAFIFGIAGVLFLVVGIGLARKPRD